MTDIRQAAIDLYDRYTHEGMDRRAFMADLTKIACSAAAATALLSTTAAAHAPPALAYRRPPDFDDAAIPTQER